MQSLSMEEHWKIIFVMLFDYTEKMDKLIITSNVSKLNPLRRPMLSYVDYLVPLSFIDIYYW
jgi:hypothetical protein